MKAKAGYFSFLLFIFLSQLILASVTGATTRIMPLGNSITQGYASGELNEDRQVSYRKALWDKLINAGYDVNFVGSLNSGSTLFADGDHEGHPGWTDDEIVNGRPVTEPGAGKLADWLAVYQPDIVLLHIGTNGLDPSPDDVADILDVIDNYSPDTYVIVARIINRVCCEDIPPCPECGITTAFNDNVEDMAYSRVYNTNDPAYPDKIIFGADVDLEDGAGIDYHLWPSGDMENNLHPHQDPTTGEAPGYAKMANVWFSALEEILLIADFTADPISGVDPLTVNFTDQSIGNVTSWSWDFGDGSISGDQNPSHTYNDPGGYTVNLTVNGQGGTDTETKADYIVVGHLTPVANFTADPTIGAASLTVRFTDESAGDIISWLWEFGDGSTSTEQHPNHTYNSPGNYSVSLSITNAEGSDIETKTDYIVVNYSARSEIIGTWSSGIWVWDVAASLWTKIYSGVPPGAMAAGDFTGDGMADVASTWSSGLWYQNSATLAWTRVYYIAPDRLAAGDITGDGVDEIIGCGGAWSSGVWYRDVANGTWHHPWENTPVGAIAAGDVTGDGKADMISCRTDGLWYQDGATLDQTNVYDTAPNKVATGDVTGDGQAEIIGTWSSGIWYWDVAKSEWTKMTSYTTDRDIAAGDFTGDGKADIAACWSSGLWYQNGATLGWTRVYSIAPYRVTAGDITRN